MDGIPVNHVILEGVLYTHRAQSGQSLDNLIFDSRKRVARIRAHSRFQMHFLG